MAEKRLRDEDLQAIIEHVKKSSTPVSTEELVELLKASS